MANILIADDDLEIQELLKFTLENEGHNVRTASDGEEAIRKVNQEKPEIILLDVMMPKCTGFEACERLRSDPATCLIPIILLTSLSQAKDRITGIKLGADEYLTKPFEPMELNARIEALLRRVNADKNVNPLTGLPISVSIQSELEKRIKEKTPFASLYLDIDKFKSINDAYGFEKGDNVIKLISTLLRTCIGNIGIENNFIGHFEGDDFFIITPEDKAEPLAKRIIEVFDACLPKQYDKETLKRGYVSAVNKKGEQVVYPLIRISIGIAVINPSEYRHYSEVLDAVKEKWKEAKLTQGSSYVI